MKAFKLIFSMTLPAFGSSDCMVQLNSDHADFDVIFSPFSFTHYAIPIETGIAWIIVCSLIFLFLEYNLKLLQHAKTMLVIHILQKGHIPLLSIEELLYDIAKGNFSKISSKRISANFVKSIVNQYRSYANSRHIQFTVSENGEYTNCRINEIVLSFALQHLLYKMIEITDTNGCIDITTTQSANFWKINISNCKGMADKTRKKFLFIPILSSLFGYNVFCIVNKIIHMNGGKISGYIHGRMMTIQITIPLIHETQNEEEATASTNNTNIQKESDRKKKEEQEQNQTDNRPKLLLIMSDKTMEGYLKSFLSEDFQISVLESPNLLINTAIRQTPDLIIIDDIINGRSSGKLCSQIKAEKNTSKIPLILLVNDEDNESYLSHANSGADLLILKTTPMCKFKTDLHLFINHHISLRRQTTPLKVDDTPAEIPDTTNVSDEKTRFLNKVRELLDKNIPEKYNIDQLSRDMAMSRTSLFVKFKKYTGKSPIKFISLYKMETAGRLLKEGEVNVGEVAARVGYSEKKYFTKLFKNHFNATPTDYQHGEND